MEMLNFSSSEIEVSNDLESSSENLMSNLLDILMFPTPCNLAQKRKVFSNKLPVGQKHAKGKVT